MEIRTEELTKLRSYMEEIDKDLTLILQSLQWDRNHILQHPTMVPCQYDSSHKILSSNVELHEKECLLWLNGYSKDDEFLPEPLSTNVNTLIKLGKEDISQIIDNAARSDPTFKRGNYMAPGFVIDSLYSNGSLIVMYLQYFILIHFMELNGYDILLFGNLEPQTLGRLQCTYSMDERRAIHDAVVSAAPSCHDLADLALPSVGGDDKAAKTKSRTEILAELRDMRRRRTKYRVAAKSKNYSDVLRDVIKTQMEIYNEVLGNMDSKTKVISTKEHKDEQKDNSIRNKDDNKDTKEHARGMERRERYGARGTCNEYMSRDGDRRYDRRDTSREERHDVRHSSRHASIGKDDKRRHRHKSRDRQRDKSKERRLDSRRERDSKRNESYDAECSIRKNDVIPREYKRDRNKREDRDPDLLRARNLLTEIKSEIESTTDKAIYLPNRSNEYKSEIKSEIRNRDYRLKGYGYYESVHSDIRDKDRGSERKSGDHKRHKDKRERELKESRDKHERHKRSYRDESYEKESKKSRVEEKHRRYYEIYAELDSRKNKSNEHDVDFF